MKGGDGHGWVTASSVEGLEELTLHDLKPGSYMVRLLFAEPNELEVGNRVQHASLQDRVVLTDFDVRAEAGGVMRGVEKETEDGDVNGTLQLKLSAVKGKTLISGIEIVRNE